MSKTKVKVKTKVKEVKGLEIKYQHFMEAYQNFRKFKPSLVDFLLMTILVYLINPKNELEYNSKKFFIEFSHKLLGIGSGLLLFVLVSFGSNFNFQYTTIAFCLALFIGFLPIVSYELIQKEYQLSSVFKKFHIIKDNTALVLSV